MAKQALLPREVSPAVGQGETGPEIGPADGGCAAGADEVRLDDPRGDAALGDEDVLEPAADAVAKGGLHLPRAELARPLVVGRVGLALVWIRDAPKVGLGRSAEV